MKEGANRATLLEQLVASDIENVQSKVRGDQRREEAQKELEECQARGKMVNMAVRGVNAACEMVWETWELETERVGQ